MSYSEADVSAARSAMDKCRADSDGEVAAALTGVGLSAERALRQTQLRDDMIRIAHQTGASLHQLSGASGLGRKTVTAIVEAGHTAH